MLSYFNERGIRDPQTRPIEELARVSLLSKNATIWPVA